MRKEIIIIIIILLLIFLLEFISQKSTESIVTDIDNRLNNLKIGILESPENNNKILQESNEIYDELMNKHDFLAIYIDHVEIEKIETNLITCKSYVETKDYSQAIAELELTMFSLKHMQSKYGFNLPNIF